MGHLIGDGKAIDVVVPAGVYSHGDLYRINDWTGVLLNDCSAAETVRTRALEVAFNRIWAVKYPAGLTPAVGDVAWWSTGAGTKRGDTDLVAEGTGSATGPIFKCLVAKNAAGYVQGMIVGQDDA